MIELKILRESEYEERKLDEGGIVELPPWKETKLIEDGVARTASHSDFLRESLKTVL